MSTSPAHMSFGQAMMPAIMQAHQTLAEAGYRYDQDAHVFVRTFADNPISIDRAMRYVTRTPQNRRIKKQWRNTNRRMRRRGVVAT